MVAKPQLQIPGLYEKLGIEQADVDRLRRMKIEAAAQRLMFASIIVGRGGNLHRVNWLETAKRRRKNKVAKRQRKVNRGK